MQHQPPTTTLEPDEHPFSINTQLTHMRKIREALRRSILPGGSNEIQDLIRERAQRIRALTPADDARAIRGDFQVVLNDLGKALKQAPEEIARRTRQKERCTAGR